MEWMNETKNCRKREEGKKCGCIEKGVCFFKKLTATLCTMAVPL